jgi:hypothetical protein
MKWRRHVFTGSIFKSSSDVPGNLLAGTVETTKDNPMARVISILSLIAAILTGVLSILGTIAPKWGGVLAMAVAVANNLAPPVYRAK